MRSNLGSCLSSLIRQYVKLKQALGRDFGREGRVLAHVDQFLSKVGASDFTQTEFEGWCRTQLHLSSGVRRGRMQVVRNFCLYRRRTEPNCFVPDDRLLPTCHQVVRPHIFSEMEIMRLLQAAARVPTSTRLVLRPLVLRLAIVLLYTTGLRRGELVRLTLGDYDQRERTLLIRESKFHKSRYLPLSVDASTEINAYLTARTKHRLPMLSDSPLLWSGHASERGFSADSRGTICASCVARLIYASLTADFLVSTIIVIRLRSRRYCAGTVPAPTSKPNFRYWQRIWGTYQSSQRNTICILYQIWRTQPATASVVAMAHSSSDQPKEGYRDEKSKYAGPCIAGFFQQICAGIARVKSAHTSQLP